MWVSFTMFLELIVYSSSSVKLCSNEEAGGLRDVWAFGRWTEIVCVYVSIQCFD